jgi:hypothetical protein
LSIARPRINLPILSGYLTVGNLANYRSTYSSPHPIPPSTDHLVLKPRLIKLHFLTHPTQTTWFNKRQALRLASSALLLKGKHPPYLNIVVNSFNNSFDYTKKIL